MSQFKSGLTNDPTDRMANNGQQITFTHIPTGQSVSFKAILKDFDDSFTSNWDPTSVFGRMDDIHTFQGTTRQISFTWQVIAGSAKEAAENFERVGKLVTFLYPVYERDSAGMDSSTMVASPLIGIKYANFITKASGEQLIGSVAGFSNKPDIDMGFFDSDDGSMADSDLTHPSLYNIYPKLIELSCEFTVFHTEPVGFNSTSRAFRSGDNYPYTTKGLHSGPPAPAGGTSPPGSNTAAQAASTTEPKT